MQVWNLPAYPYKETRNTPLDCPVFLGGGREVSEERTESGGEQGERARFRRLIKGSPVNCPRATAKGNSDIRCDREKRGAKTTRSVRRHNLKEKHVEARKYWRAPGSTEKKKPKGACLPVGGSWTVTEIRLN